jgi:hypothetical protein
MSRGPGHVIVAITEIARHLDDAPLTYRDLAGIIYGVPAPTRAQRETVARACRRLADTDQLNLTRVHTQVTRQRKSSPRYQVRGDEVVTVEEGAILRADSIDHEEMIRVRAESMQDFEALLEQAAEGGVSADLVHEAQHQVRGAYYAYLRAHRDYLLEVAERQRHLQRHLLAALSRRR